MNGNDLPSETRLQKQRLTLSIVLPLQKGTHASHVRERIEAAVRQEFANELAETTIEASTTEHGVQDLGVWEESLELSRPISGFTDNYIGLTPLTKESARAYLVRTFLHGHTDKVLEYIDEAEHQDGDGYWDQFHSLEQVHEDFERFCEHYVAYAMEDLVAEDTTAHHHH